MSDAPRFAVVADGSRVVVRDHRPSRAATMPGAVGLWRAAPPRGPRFNVFEVAAPLAVPDGSRGPAALGAAAFTAHHAALVRWAEATADGGNVASALPGWAPPERPSSMVLAAHGFGELALQEGFGLLGCALDWGPRRVTLRCPSLFLLGSAEPARLAWAEHLCEQATERWRYVRLALLRASPYPCVTAEIDFTGAPHALVLGLLVDARVALARVSQVLAPAFEALEAGLPASVLLARGPRRSGPAGPPHVPGASPAASTFLPATRTHTTLPW